MINSLTKQVTDRSGKEAFSFSFFCDNCGSEWKSPVIPFESGGVTSFDNEEVCQMVWAQEHKNAFDRSNLEAHFHFNYCSESEKWVCDECFGVGAPG
ncbi:MAG: hypothetical protein FWB95_07405 [Treponema sp.]|nr:hypothetical protein [Treponema sp.]